MCVIIHKPKNIYLTEEVLRFCWNANHDGAGFMYAENDKLVINKGLMKIKHFFNEYEIVKDKELLIHFRFASRGEISSEMCHPFTINEDLAVVHNGHINIPLEYDRNISDSYWFVENIFKKSKENFLEDEVFMKLLRVAISSSIMVFMDNKGKVTKIGNEGGSIKKDNVWFSNGFWLD